ncbi:MAG: hypothetical protein OXL98_14400 [Acidimicrobiaceae bacterium]|nr:hypothetical protein [Acidimicrobiaceae bacterium]
MFDSTISDRTIRGRRHRDASWFVLAAAAIGAPGVLLDPPMPRLRIGLYGRRPRPLRPRWPFRGIAAPAGASGRRGI